MSYIELHCHSAYSFLDATSMPDELLTTANTLGYPALALTDHNSVSGSMEFAVKAQELGIKAIHGSEVTLADGRHLTLLVRDRRGWANLSRLLTLAHRKDRIDPSLELEEIELHFEGLICLSGCAGHGVHDRSSLYRLREIFTPEHLRVELQRPLLYGDRKRNRKLQATARELDLCCIATGNVHSHSAARAYLQDVFVAIKLGLPLERCEAKRRGNRAHVLATADLMRFRFSEYPEAVSETLVLSEQIEFDLVRDLHYRYPRAGEESADLELAELCHSRLGERYQSNASRQKAEERLMEELRVIRSLNLSGFFILHYEILELAREVAIDIRGPSAARAVLPPGRGRGSSVSSIVCYLTGLSHIDPISNDLMLGRFLSEELTETLPDIDLDFARDIRAELILKIHQRYGHDRSALVAAFPTYRTRGAVREIGKALSLPEADIERVVRTADHGLELNEVIENVLGKSKDLRWQWLTRLVEEARGLPRHISQHPGGMIVSTEPLVDCCPVIPVAMEGRQIVQWEKDSCADARFIKIDLLGLGMLSALERCVDEIHRTRNELIDLSRISFNDRETYDSIQEADTTGVFQIESRAQMHSLARTKPSSLEDLTVQVALVRPGPIQGGAVNPYIQRRAQRLIDPEFEPPYDHPLLEPILKDTLGTIVFQEQVLQIAVGLAGFTDTEAEGLRRAMSRKRSDAAMERYRDKFITGANERGIEKELAQKIFAQVRGFSGFGFPKAHSAAFGLLAYQTAWLKVHYPAEYLAALLNEQPMGFYPPDALIHYAQRKGVVVRPPDVNMSSLECESGEEGREIRVGLGYVLGAKKEELEGLVIERHRSGSFKGPEDLLSRVPLSRPTLFSLAWSGALDHLVGGDRRLALWKMGGSSSKTDQASQGQLQLPLPVPDSPQLAQIDEWEALLADYRSLRLTAGKHPLAILREQLKLDSFSSRDLGTIKESAQSVEVAGLVIARQRPQTAKGTVFLLLEDEFGTINLIVPSHIYKKYRLTIRTERLLSAKGRVERYASAKNAIHVIVSSVAVLDLDPEVQVSVSSIEKVPKQPASELTPELPPMINFGQSRGR